MHVQTETTEKKSIQISTVLNISKHPIQPTMSGLVDSEVGEKTMSSYEDLVRTSDNASTGQSSSGNPSTDESSRILSKSGETSTTAPEDLIGQAETRHVCWLRTMVAATLIVAGVLTCLGMYYASRQAEQRHFENQFEDNAWSVIDALHYHFLRGIGILDNSFLEEIDNTTLPLWPFIVFPGYESVSASIRNLGLFHTVGIAMVVEQDERLAWEYFSATYGKAWIEAGLAFEKEIDEEDWHFGQLDRESHSHSQETFEAEDDLGAHSHEEGAHRNLPVVDFSNGIANTIYEVDQSSTKVIPAPEADTYYVWWQASPIDSGLVNFNLKSHPSLGAEATRSLTSGHVLLGKTLEWNPSVSSKDDYYPQGPSVPIFFPLSLGENKLAVVTAMTTWQAYLQVGSEMPENANGMHITLHNDCGQEFHFEVIGETVQNVGHEHTEEYLDMAIVWELAEELEHLTMFSRFAIDDEYCPYHVWIHPTNEMRDHFYTNGPLLYTCLVAAVFVFTALVFLGYDFAVERRQKTVMKSAVKSHTIVSSLFPRTVRKRLFGEEDVHAAKGKKNGNHGRLLINQKAKLRNFVSRHDETANPHNSGTSNMSRMEQTKPIADLFPCSTVMFADIANFTAWSSTREPSSVFTLLESLYGAFDRLAVHHKVFKVETIGDCYVAATGVPEAQEDHAVRMVKFADRVLHQMKHVTRELEIHLGPDTTELSIRVGLHSGPVTAGVLRGQKSRFQLFGDTVNTAARMESNGRPGHIQCSQATANLLIEAGKEHWLDAREDLVHAKGKGEIQTYWVILCSHRPKHHSVASGEATSAETSSSDGEDLVISTGTKTTPETHLHRLVDWHVDLLAGLLKNIVARRRFRNHPRDKPPLTSAYMSKASITTNVDRNPRDEYVPVIALPRFDDAASHQSLWSNEDVSLDPVVLEQLEDYVTKVALGYNSANPFHNFDHASHVTMAAHKTLKRIVEAADFEDVQLAAVDGRNTAAKMHEYSFGITSDPLTHFACVFSALIHDVDHPGVPNFQLVKEGDEMANLYDNQSVAEQNSIDLAWEMLMEDCYKELRRALFATPQEQARFRQLVVNSVMATDIFDPQLRAMREDRWERAFASNDAASMDRKATIVIEHILQAADIAHTMQHWHVYQKWNRRFFHEMYRAWVYGRSEKDPSLGWYQGELWFYDNYIIPLAKKLKECGVFGVSSDEFLNYATMNRSEWSSRGEAIVKELKSEVQAKYGCPSDNGAVRLARSTREPAADEPSRDDAD